MLKKPSWFSTSLLLAGALALYWFRPWANDRSPQPVAIRQHTPVSDNPLSLISTGQRTRVESIAFSPDSKKLAMGVSSWTQRGESRSLFRGVMQIRDAQTGHLLQTVPLYTRLLDHPDVQFSPDGKTVAVAAKGKIRRWNLQRKQWQSFSKGSPEGYWVTYSPDGKMLATSSTFIPKIGSTVNLLHAILKENPVSLWDARTGKRLRSLHGHTEKVVSATFSPNSKTLATASHDNTVRLWDVNTGSLKQTLKGQSGQLGHMMFAVAFAPNGTTVASGDGMEIRIWDAVTGELLKTIRPANKVLSLAFSPNGQTLASVGPFPHKVKGNVWGPHGTLLVPKEQISAGEVRLWDVQTGKLQKTFRSGHSARETVFAPNGKTLVNTSDDDTITVWSIQ